MCLLLPVARTCEHMISKTRFYSYKWRENTPKTHIGVNWAVLGRFGYARPPNRVQHAAGMKNAMVKSKIRWMMGAEFGQHYAFFWHASRH